VIKDILHLGNEGELGQQAASSRAGVVLDIDLFGQLKKFLAGAPLDGQQFITVHPALPFRDGRFEMLRRKRPQQQSFQSALPLDDPQGVAALAHGALAQYLAGDDKVGAALGHIFPRFAQQVDTAVHTGIESLAVAVYRISDDLQVVQPLVDDLDGDVEFLGDADRFGFAAAVLAGAGAEG